jgi:hypothetical protein
MRRANGRCRVELGGDAQVGPCVRPAEPRSSPSHRTSGQEGGIGCSFDRRDAERWRDAERSGSASSRQLRPSRMSRRESQRSRRPSTVTTSWGRAGSMDHRLCLHRPNPQLRLDRAGPSSAVDCGHPVRPLGLAAATQGVLVGRAPTRLPLRTLPGRAPSWWASATTRTSSE